MDDRGQALTLEAILASVLLISSLVFAFQATAVTPVSSTAASTNEEVQRASVAAGILDVMVANGSAKRAILAWNDSSGFLGTGAADYFVAGGPPNAFGRTLDGQLATDGVVYNVDLVYVTANDTLETTPLVDQGTPSDRATRVVRTVTLFDDDLLIDADGHPTNVTVDDSSTFYAPNAASGDLYNVVRVEVTVWRS